MERKEIKVESQNVCCLLRWSREMFSKIDLKHEREKSWKKL